MNLKRSCAGALCALVLAGLWPSESAAQMRYPMPVQFGYRYGGPESDVRIQVTPKEAAVYVDGYYAGLVDDFDGTFQRLHVIAGEHEIVIYLEGYRARHERLYLSPNATRKITGSLERLGPGEQSAPPPVPVSPLQPPMPSPGGRGAPPRRGGAPPPPRGPSTGGQVAPGDIAATRLGTVVIRVQPSGADVLIDGEHWSGPEGEERLVVQLSEGQHVVEIRKAGYRATTTEVQVRPGETIPINVSLSRQQ